MTRSGEAQPWKKRQAIPDPQVRDAADQYEAAYRILDAQPPGSGLHLPLINTAAVAIELYLKSLSAGKVYAPLDGPAGGYTVHAAPALKGRDGHILHALLQEVPDDVRLDLEDKFKAVEIGDFHAALGRCEGAFATSRFPFEKASDLAGVDLGPLGHVVRFLREFIGRRKPVERIK